MQTMEPTQAERAPESRRVSTMKPASTRIQFFSGPDGLAVNQHLALLRIGLITQLGNPAVDANPALGNQVFSATP